MTVIFQQLQTQATWSNAPAGKDHGFDPDFREPYATQAAGGQPITDSRVYGPEIGVPCQMEVKTYEEISMLAGGDDPLTNIVFVLHRRDLATADLLDPDTGNIKLKRNDKITRLEKNGRTVLLPVDELYVCRINPGSIGFGPDGYDLHIVLTKGRDAEPSGKG